MRELIRREQHTEREAGWGTRSQGAMVAFEEPPRRSRLHPEGRRYQLARVSGERSSWVILDTETGTFEHWIEVPEEQRYHVYRCQYGPSCSITAKRSVYRGMEP